MKKTNHNAQLIHLFERLNATKIPTKSIIAESNLRAQASADEINRYFQHYKIDTSKLNPQIIRQIYINWDMIDHGESVSDIEDNEDGSVSVELDDHYGRHWTKFANSQAWQKYYEDNMLANGRHTFEKKYKEIQQTIDKKQQGVEHEKATRNTIGNIVSPDVMNKLKAVGNNPVAEGFEDLDTQHATTEPNVSVNPEGTDIPNPAIPESLQQTLIKKEVRDLKVGDVLASSGAKVIVAPSAGIKTPTGKVDIGVEYPGGKQRMQMWGKYTIVSIKPNETSTPLPADPNKLPDEISNNSQPSIGL